MKLKKAFALLLVFGIGITTYAGTHLAKKKQSHTITKEKTETGIHFFKGSWKEALAEAKSEKKLIFLDAYASWCSPCKMMARGTFTKKEVGDFFNANFINVKMDMEKNADGIRLSNKYNLRAYPTLYFIDHKEKLIHQELGYQKPKQLISIGKKVKAL